MNKTEVDMCYGLSGQVQILIMWNKMIPFYMKFYEDHEYFPFGGLRQLRGPITPAERGKILILAILRHGRSLEDKNFFGQTAIKISNPNPLGTF